jgi:DNA-binding transcriptional regulator YiaG
MPNIATVLKAEITRLARKEVRDEADGLRKAVAAQRAEIASLKRRLATLESALKRLGREQGRAAKAPEAAPEEGAGEGGHRFSAKGLATSRKKLGLSAADFALLVGTTGQSIYAWEAGKSRPRPQALRAIVDLRGIGKREVAERLAALKG